LLADDVEKPMGLTKSPKINLNAIGRSEEEHSFKFPLYPNGGPFNLSVVTL